MNSKGLGKDKKKKEKLTASDFRMNKEMVERYLKMVKAYDEACCDLVNNATMDISIADFEDESRGIYWIETPLYFIDDTHILDDWERAKEYQKRYTDRIEALNITKRPAVIGAYELEKGKNDFEKRLFAPYNVLAKEFNEFWLPLLERQCGQQVLSGSGEDITLCGFVGTFCSWLEDAIDLTRNIIAKNIILKDRSLKDWGED